MSAIIAGKSCRKCKREYYLSLGHPKWYDDVIKRRMPTAADYLQFERVAVSGMCPRCSVEKHVKSLSMDGVFDG